MFAKILLLALLAAVTAEDSVRLWQDVIEDCAAESGFRPDMDSSEVEHVEGCGLVCAMKRLDTMDENGHWKAEKIIALIPKEYPKYEGTVAALRKCAPIVGETECETPNLLRKCLLEELPCNNDWECGVASYLYLFYQQEMLPTDQLTVLSQFKNEDLKNV